MFLEATADAFGHWHLPFEGGALEQPAWLMQDLLLWKRLADIAQERLKTSNGTKRH